MRTLAPQQFETFPQGIAGRSRFGRSRCLSAVFAASAAFLAAQLTTVNLAAQSTAASPPALAQPTAHPHKKPGAQKLISQPAAVQPPAPTVAAPPPLPNWPANKQATQASVVWDSHGLFIQAANSSLDQILSEVSLKTGATVEGMGADLRIFGIYGPGPARDVLSELLDGTGYNILMVGDRGEGTPRRIVLSGRPTGPAQPGGNANPGANGDSENDNDQEAQQAPDPDPPPQPAAPAYNPGQAMPARTPQQFFQDRLQQRQQQIQQQQQQIQQQQQQQQNNPQN